MTSLCLFGSNAALAALSAVTANTIQGSKPRLDSTLEQIIKDKKDFELFGLSVSGTNYFTATEIDIFFTNLNLNLKPKQHKPSDIPISSFTLALDKPNGTDTDGDNYVAIEPQVGGIALKWYKAGTDVALTTELGETFCDLVASGISPELRMEGDIKVKTEYGDPSEQDYPDSSILISETPRRIFDYSKVFDPTADLVCYARPVLTYGTGNYAGPSYMWNTKGGFIKQSDIIYSNNFPTTGADGVYFDLMLFGVDARQLTWGDAATAGITGKVVKNGITATISDITATKVKITLTGPKATAAQQLDANALPNINSGSSGTGTVAIPTSLPAQFIIEGKSGSTVKVKYGFELKKWYINRGTAWGNGSEMEPWCTKTGYRLPRALELTNATGAVGGTGGNMPAGGTSIGNHYNRRIGGGLFSEWGSMDSYTDSGFDLDRYLTKDIAGTGQLFIRSSDGLGFSSVKGRGVCVTP